jgi:hypothetical protein
MIRIAMIFLALGVGALAGYLYHRYVGCRTGGCAITNNAWSSVLAGAAIAWIAFAPLIERMTVKMTKHIEGRSTHGSQNP